MKALTMLAAAAAIGAVHHVPATSWTGTEQHRPQAGVAQRRAKDKAARKQRAKQRRKAKR